MASFVNKLANSITNSTGSIIGRENLAKMSNSINQAFNKNKYRDLLRNGNVVQLLSRNSHKALEICSVPNYPTKLAVYGGGQIGPEFTNAHFVININPENKHIAFQNMNNYLGMSVNNFIPEIVNESEIIEKTKKKTKIIRMGRIEFRLHEIFGSDDFFALESVHATGFYLCVTEQGLVQVTKNKSDPIAHFQLHLIQEYAKPIVAPVRPPPPTTAIAGAGAAAAATTPQAANTQFTDKYEEARSANSNSDEGTVLELRDDDASADKPPCYTSLYPALPQ